jgi:CRP-like cAMP-binding protein
MKKISNISKLKLLEFLNRVPLFKSLEPHDRQTVANIPNIVVLIEQGSVFIKQDQLDSDFYILLNGEAEISVDKQFIATTTSGHFIGEVGFICNEPRSASVKAITDIIALRVTRDLFDVLPLRVKESIKQKIINGLVTRVSKQNGKIISLEEQVDHLELQLNPDRDKVPENAPADDGLKHVLNIKE